MSTIQSAPRARHRRVARLARALLALLLVPLALAVEPGSGPADAATPIVLGPSTSTAHFQQGFGDLGDHPMPDCDSKNIEGRYGFAKWTVTSSLGKNSIVFPGTEWDITLEMLADYVDYDPWFYNDGPDPLMTVLMPYGPIERLNVKAELPAPNLGVHDVYQGDDPVGPRQEHGPWGYSWDSNSKPKLDGIHKENSDGVDLRLTFHVRATKPGEITLPKLVISGYDSSPIAGDIGCEMPVDFSWTVIEPDVPVAAPDKAATDARYPLAVNGDANGGEHIVTIPVLANDDDPNVPGGPGDPAQVRLSAWSTASAKGGFVSCGTDAQNGLPKGTAFGQLSATGCVYRPPVGFEGVDTFTYTARQKTGEKESKGTVSVTVRPNRAPTGTAVVFGTATNVDDTFDLAPSVGDLDGDPVTCSLASPAAPAVGTAVVTSGCKLQWDNTSPGFNGNVTVGYKVCDTHPTLVEPNHGAGVTRSGTYELGNPADLSKTTSRRCATRTATIAILPGLILPPTAGTDLEIVDAGYPGDAVGAYTVRIPVLANDTDGNGPKPAVPGVTLQILDGPSPAEGTASIAGDKVVFTPAAGFAGPVELTYRVCEDPDAQNPPYADDPNTPLVNEGLAWCGVGTVSIDVLGNAAPALTDDAAAVAHDATIVDLDLGANDASDDGLVCSAGVPTVSDPALVDSVSLQGDCTLDLDPADGTDGVVEVTYEACDQHHLGNPAHPAVPYGADGRSPGGLAPRCATATATITIIGPVPPPADPDEGDPAPVCAADVAATPAGQPVTVAVLANDSDLNQKEEAGPVTLTGPTAKEPATTTEGGSAAMDDGETQVVYTPADGFSGVDTFTYSARDELGQGCTAEVTVTVTADQNGGGNGDGSGDGTGDGSGDGSGDGRTDGGANASGTGGSTTTTVAGTTSVAGTTTGTLPVTGSATGSLLAIGLALVAAGAAAGATGRRLRRD